MPAHDHCCVPGCSNRRDKHPDLSFHTFPLGNEALRKRWIAGIRRDEGADFKVTQSTVVCSIHFASDDFIVHPGEAGLKKRVCRRLKPGAVPRHRPLDERLLRPSPTVRAAARSERLAEKAALASLPFYGPPDEVTYLREKLARTEAQLADVSEELCKEKAKPSSSPCLAFSFKKLCEANMLEFYTGLTLVMWTSLWNLLDCRGNIQSKQSAATDTSGRQRSYPVDLEKSLSLEDQLVMTLVRLRLGYLEQDLAFHFNVSVATVSRVFTMWINFMYLRLGSIPIWPKWEHIEATMPESFKVDYPSTAVIIDATEIKCEVPAELSLQSQHYSQYKSSTTLKGLVGIAPNGAFTFISQLFSGAISDRQLTIESGFLNLLRSLPPQKNVMADRGFEIQDLLVPYGLLLNIPPFKGSSSHLSAADVVKTQKIARTRIHVERAIGQVKKRFRILHGTMPLSLYGSATQIWTTCCLLSNLGGDLIAQEK